ncbi:MAG TPA: hypothetical protein VGR38_02965 [Candidatus Polarisedimenticolia bacterium]|jgi:hypothetical protein|nr:hypothetical protein [Candidatus Polarisedimenticolia bacterium]
MRDREHLIVEIRRYPHASWGTLPRQDGSWECFFEISGPRGTQRLHAYGKDEVDSLEKMLEILRREHISRGEGERP